MLSSYPGLTDSEFGEACRTLERNCHDNLDDTSWAIVKWDGNELQIKERRYRARNHFNDRHTRPNLSDELAEADDEESLVRIIDDLALVRVIDFSIVLSPTYRVPVLWLSLSTMRSARLEDLEEVYAHLVTAEAQDALQTIGVMGGISMANHPVSDLPAFFIHPCNTPEALTTMNDGTSLDPFRYLLLWFGIIGSAVGLHIPTKVYVKDNS